MFIAIINIVKTRNVHLLIFLSFYIDSQICLCYILRWVIPKDLFITKYLSLPQNFTVLVYLHTPPKHMILLKLHENSKYLKIFYFLYIGNRKFKQIHFE